MKTIKKYYGITFYSNDFDLNKCRKTDIFYITGLTFYGNSLNIPDDKQLAKSLKSMNLFKIEITTNPKNRYELIAILNY